MGEDRRLAAFEGAYQSFVACVSSMTQEQLVAAMESASPRDLLARLVGWNRLTLGGAQAILTGKAPPYHSDFASGYRRVNAELVGRNAATDRAALLAELEQTRDALVTFLSGLSPEQWNADQGVRHPDGGPATVRRCLEELSRDYLDATDEITVWLETKSAS